MCVKKRERKQYKLERCYLSYGLECGGRVQVQIHGARAALTRQLDAFLLGVDARVRHVRLHRWRAVNAQLQA